MIAAGTMVDSNVLLDVLTADPMWSAWSLEHIEAQARIGWLGINPLVYAEVSVGFRNAQALDVYLPSELYRRLPLPYAAAYLAGQAFREYRRAGGVGRSPLPDFYIGAHAQTERLALPTRDAARYRTYFPRLALIAPE